MRSALRTYNKWKHSAFPSRAKRARNDDGSTGTSAAAGCTNRVARQWCRRFLTSVATARHFEAAPAAEEIPMWVSVSRAALASMKTLESQCQPVRCER